MILGVAWYAAPVAQRAGDGVPTFVPDSATDLVESLPSGAGAVRAQIRQSQSLLQAHPGDPVVAASVARRHFDVARRSGDPRAAGRAQAAIAKWWDDPDAPTPVVLMRAAILQHQHRFDAALTDLRRINLREPSNLQAWLSRASLEQTTGELDAARQSCERIVATWNHPAGVLCVAELQSLGGDRGALQRVQDLREKPRASDAERSWMATVHAEMAERLGDRALAERAFRDAIAIDGSPYAHVAYADLLLRTGRTADVVSLLESAPRTDAVLLRRAIALRRLRDPAADVAIADLRERFAAAALRGDSAHLREMARMALEIDHDPPKALDLALRNWAEQKESADALLVLEASAAARRPQDSDVVRAFVARHGIRDVRMDAYL